MRARPLVALALTCAAVGIGAWWSLHRELPAAATPVVSAKPVEERAPAPPPVVPESAPAAVVPKRTNDADPKSGTHWWDVFVPGKSTRRAPAPVEEEPTPTIPIDGVVIVTDRSGRDHASESGTFHPAFYEPRDPEAKEGDAGFGRRGFGGSWQDADEIAVENGRFHVEVPAGHELGASKLKLGGKFVAVDGEPQAVSAGAPITLRGHWIEGVPVRVVDRTTKTVLDDVTVIRTEGTSFSAWGRDDPGDPAQLETVVEHGSSPVLVAPRENSFGLQMKDHVWIRARDHAWRQLEIDFADPTERTLELPDAATLVVDVQGELPADPGPTSENGLAAMFGGGRRRHRDEHDRDPMLRLRRPVEKKSFDDAVKEALGHYDEAKASDFPTGRKPSLDEFKQMIESMRGEYEARTGRGELVSERPAKAGENRFEAIAAEDLVATVEIGVSYESPLTIASAPAHLAAGSTTNVTLLVAKVEAPTPVPLAGTIVVPSGWDVEELRLEIAPVDLKGKTAADERRIPSDQWQRMAGRPGAYRWNAGRVLPAKYVFKVDPTGIVKVVVVPAAGAENVEIVLPEPATLHLRVVDSATGKPVRVDDMNLDWMPRREEIAFAEVAPVSFKYDEGSARYTARVPVGTGVLMMFGDANWVLDEEPFTADVHSGEQEVVASVHAACGASFELTCAGTKVPWNERNAFEVKFEPVDGKGRLSWTSHRDDRLAFSVTAPGRYTVTFPALDGYEIVAPFEVEILAGEFVKKTVELRKK